MKFRKAISIFLTALMLISMSLLPAFAFSEKNEPEIITVSPQLYLSSENSRYAEDVLSAYVDIDLLRACISEGISKAQSVVNFEGISVPRKFIGEMMDFVFYCMPEAFNVSQIGYPSVNEGNIPALYFYYYPFADTEAEYEKCFSDMKKAADKLLSGIENNNFLSDEKKALLLHDRLCLHNTYTIGEPDIVDFTAYGALVNQSSVCQGYAMAYMYLLNRVNIKNYYCSSDALYHGWNIVYIDGAAYHVDVTWDDIEWGGNGGNAAGALKHNNFLLSTNGIMKTGHTATDFDTSPVSTKYDNYYWQNSETAFQLVNNKLYYIDNVSQKLMCADDNKELCSVSDIWYWGTSSMWVGNFSRLSFAGNELLYSVSKGIYKYDLQTGENQLVCAPEFSQGLAIFGFVYEDGYLVCEGSATPPWSGDDTLVIKKIKYEPSSVYVKGIEIRSLPSKALYYTGEDFLSDGLSINVLYSDGTRTAVYGGFECTGFSSSFAGTKTVTVTYNGYACNFSVNVLERPVNVPDESIGFADGENALLRGETVFAVAGLNVDGLLSQVKGEAGILKENGEAADGNSLTATGMVLVLPDNSRKAIVVLGDVDKDGKISSADARLALRASVGLEKYEENTPLYMAANVDHAGSVSSGDARLILRASVNLENHKSWLQ